MKIHEAKLDRIKRKTSNSIIIVDDLTPLFPQLMKTCTKISSTYKIDVISMKHVSLTEVYGTLCPITAVHALFKGTFAEIRRISI